MKAADLMLKNLLVFIVVLGLLSAAGCSNSKDGAESSNAVTVTGQSDVEGLENTLSGSSTTSAAESGFSQTENNESVLNSQNDASEQSKTNKLSGMTLGTPVSAVLYQNGRKTAITDPEEIRAFSQALEGYFYQRETLAAASLGVTKELMDQMKQTAVAVEFIYDSEPLIYGKSILANQSAGFLYCVSSADGYNGNLFSKYSSGTYNPAQSDCEYASGPITISDDKGATATQEALKQLVMSFKEYVQ